MSFNVLKLGYSLATINENKIVKVVDKNTCVAAADNIKIWSEKQKELIAEANMIKKPHQDEINKINEILKKIKAVIDLQKKTLGEWETSERQLIKEHQGIDLPEMKVQSQVKGKITTFLWPTVEITDPLLFLNACLSSGKDSDLLDVIEFKTSALENFADKYKLKEFPGAVIGFQTKVYNR